MEQEWERRGIAGDWQEFSAVLDHVAETGLTYDNDEHTPGISAIGTGFVDMTGEYHAISVPIPTTRFQDKRHAVEVALQATVDQIRAAVR